MEVLTWKHNGQVYEYNGFIYVPRSSTLGKPFKPLEVDQELVEIANIGFAARKKPMKLVDGYAESVNSSGQLEFIVEPHLKLANSAAGPIIGVIIATREYVDGLAYTCADIVAVHPDFWKNGVMKGGINVLADFIARKGETPYLALRTSDEDANEAYSHVLGINNIGHKKSEEYSCHGKLCNNKDTPISINPSSPHYNVWYAPTFASIFKHLQQKPKKLIPI